MERDNSSRSRSPSNFLWLSLAFAAVLSMPITAAAQGPGTENGQWTYLGGDAWHTRYTPADQINASNFEDLEVAWRWDAASFGPSTPRATPTYVDGQLITVTGERRSTVGLNPATGEPYTDLRKRFRATLKRAGIERHFTWHGLRHTAASHLVMAGVNLRTVGKILGHKSIAMTQRYAHLSPDAFQQDWGRLADIVPKEGNGEVIELEALPL